jgi:hypothetical protein
MLIAAESEGRFESDKILFLAMSLRRFLDNVVVAPNSSLAKKIDARSDVFQVLLTIISLYASIVDSI